MERFIAYLSSVRRYSQRTCESYGRVLEDFSSFCNGALPDVENVRDYELYLLDEKKDSASSVSHHLSVLSSYCRFLIKEGVLSSNPVHLVRRPKQPKRLPVLLKGDALENYFVTTESYASEEDLAVFLTVPSEEALFAEMYKRRLRRLIISVLFGCGLRRAELISLTDSSFDRARMVLHVLGKGDKMRDVPLTGLLVKEIDLYLKARERVAESPLPPSSQPLLLTLSGGMLYPAFVDRAVKTELGTIPSLTGRKSPHVLRHTIATQLLDKGADLNSIKEFLGHQSLAATQVYTHTSIDRLRSVYAKAHPRSKK